jgi:hypothetical protein
LPRYRRACGVAKNVTQNVTQVAVKAAVTKRARDTMLDFAVRNSRIAHVVCAQKS